MTVWIKNMFRYTLIKKSCKKEHSESFAAV